jgi:hypothetical protein
MKKKGILTKIKSGYVITYGAAAGREIWPVSIMLHPDCETNIEYLYENIGKEVEFKIVYDVDKVSDDEGKKYALILEPPYISDDFQIGPDGGYEDFQTKPGFVEKRMEQMLEIIAREEFTKVGDDGLFPNHTDKDIWISGFKAGYLYMPK